MSDGKAPTTIAVSAAAAPPPSAPSSRRAARGSGQIRRTRSPPRNGGGEIFCDHVNCRGTNQTFRRVCEWNKHMDRHERPYKCRESGCESNPGFTYSGGLLRHQREVHKMHLSTKQPLFCPFPNCDRSSGNGFTRKENLEEHKRRRHWEDLSDGKDADDRVPSGRPLPSAESGVAQLQQKTPSRRHEQHQPRQHQQLQQPAPPPLAPIKRRRDSTATSTAERASGGPVRSGQLATLPLPLPDPTVDLGVAEGHQHHQMMRHLQEQLAQKDEYIRLQAAELHRLQTFIRSLPQQAIYGGGGLVMQAQLPGSGVG